MFSTNSNGQKIVSRRRALQIQREDEMRAVDCAHYLTMCLPLAVFANAGAMPCGPAGLIVTLLARCQRQILTFFMRWRRLCGCWMQFLTEGSFMTANLLRLDEVAKMFNGWFFSWTKTSSEQNQTAIFCGLTIGRFR
jgi:hypothetical protein